MKPYLTLVAGTLLLAVVGCNKETGPAGLSGDRPIAFDAAATGTQTRAAGEVSVDAALQARSFGVFASYTGKLSYENTTVSPDYMYNQEVKYNTTAQVWEYTPVKYWPNNPDDYLSFFAYSPYEENPGEGSASGIIGMSRDVDLGDPWINFRLPEYANQVDLLYGTPWLDQHRHDEGEPAMQFTFHHALACIGEVITVKMSDELYQMMHAHNQDITFTNVTIHYLNLATKARLVLRSIGSPNWKEIISGELTCSRSYNSGTLPSGLGFDHSATSNPDPITLDSGNGLFYIPLHIAGTQYPKANIYLTYAVTNNNPGGSTFIDTATASVTFTPADAGTKQAFALTLNADFNLEANVETASGGITMPGTITPEPGF